MKRRFDAEIIVELLKAGEREWSAPGSERNVATLARAFRQVFDRIDFDSKVVDTTPGDVAFDNTEAVISAMTVVLRFGVYLAAQGIEIDEDYFLQAEPDGSHRRPQLDS